MAYLMNQDRCMNPRPVSFLNEIEGLQRGLILQVTGMAKNNIWLAGADDFEAYKVVLAPAGAEKHDLIIHSTVPNQYDERLMEADFVLKANEIGRGHYITEGDEVTLAKEMVAGELVVGAEVELAGNGQLKVGAGAPLGEVIRIYNFNGQESVMIRFY